MKAVIIDSCNEADSVLSDYISTFKSCLNESGVQFIHHQLEKKDISFCKGCFGCWVKNPGKCVMTDDMEDILKDTICSDMMIMIAPLKMGFINHLMKKVQDRLIPLLHPYLELINNECHHSKRYENYPLISLIVVPEEDTDEKDMEIVGEIHQRFALNFMSELVFFATTEAKAEECAETIVTFSPTKIKAERQ